MDHCDVLVVGGGPAGSACARALVRHGLDVLVLDRKPFPRDKVCAGWITPQVLEALELAPADYAPGRVLQPIDGFRTGLIGGATREIRYPRVVSYGIRRCEFDHYLLQRSRARLRLGEPLERLERDARGWLANGRLHTPLVVGAGGHGCPVARHLGASLGSRVPVVVAREAELPLAEDDWPLRGDTPELYFARDLSGYGWCVLKQGWLNLGLGLEGGHDLAARLRAFCEGLHRAGRIPPVPAAHFKGHAYLLHGHGSRPPVADGALLVGDAAGLAYPRSGEGILPAVVSGLLAASTILAARGDYREARLVPYRQTLEARFGPLGRSRRPLPRWLARVAGGVVLRSAGLSRRLVLDAGFLHPDDGQGGSTFGLRSALRE